MRNSRQFLRIVCAAGLGDALITPPEIGTPRRRTSLSAPRRPGPLRWDGASEVLVLCGVAPSNGVDCANERRPPMEHTKTRCKLQYTLLDFCFLSLLPSIRERASLPRHPLFRSPLAGASYPYRIARGTSEARCFVLARHCLQMGSRAGRSGRLLVITRQRTSRHGTVRPGSPQLLPAGRPRLKGVIDRGNRRSHLGNIGKERRDLQRKVRRPPSGKHTQRNFAQTRGLAGTTCVGVS